MLQSTSQFLISDLNSTCGIMIIGSNRSTARIDTFSSHLSPDSKNFDLPSSSVTYHQLTTLRILSCFFHPQNSIMFLLMVSILLLAGSRLNLTWHLLPALALRELLYPNKTVLFQHSNLPSLGVLMMKTLISSKCSRCEL